MKSLFFLPLLYLMTHAAFAANTYPNAISPEAAQVKLNQGSAILIDVREKTEVDQGMPAPALWYAKSSIDADLSAFVSFLQPYAGKEIIISCRSGHRASIVIEALSGKGIKAFNMGGYSDWVKAGFPTKMGPSPKVSELTDPAPILNPVLHVRGGNAAECLTNLVTTQFLEPGRKVVEIRGPGVRTDIGGQIEKMIAVFGFKVDSPEQFFVLILKSQTLQGWETFTDTDNRLGMRASQMNRIAQWLPTRPTAFSSGSPGQFYPIDLTPCETVLQK